MVSLVKGFPYSHATTAQRDANFTDTAIGFTFFNSDKGVLETKYAAGAWKSPSLYLPPEIVTASRDLTANDIGKNLICSSGSEIILTIPLGIMPAFLGPALQISRTGTGNVKLKSVAGININGVDAGEFDLDKQWSMSMPFLLDDNEWSVSKTVVSESLPSKSYASMYFSDNTVTNTTYSAPSTPTQVLAPEYTAGSHFNGFTHLAGVLTKTSSGTQSYSVNCPMTARSGTINTLYNFHVAIDTGGGFLIEIGTRGQVYLDSTDSNARNPVSAGIIELSQGDAVAVYSSNTVSTQFSRVECLSFSIVEI